MWLSPKFGPAYINALVDEFGELELITQPHGTFLGWVKMDGVRGGNTTRAKFLAAMSEARKLGGTAIFVEEPSTASGYKLTVQVYRGER